jgi:hypothetical protein
VTGPGGKRLGILANDTAFVDVYERVFGSGGCTRERLSLIARLAR